MWKWIISQATRPNLYAVLGGFGFLHELIIREHERPYILAFCAALMALKFTLPADRAITRKRGQKEEEK